MKLMYLNHDSMSLQWILIDLKKEDEIKINSFVIATRRIIPLYFFSSKAHFLAFKFKTKSILMLRVACFWHIIVVNFSNSIYKKITSFIITMKMVILQIK